MGQAFQSFDLAHNRKNCANELDKPCHYKHGVHSKSTSSRNLPSLIRGSPAPRSTFPSLQFPISRSDLSSSRSWFRSCHDHRCQRQDLLQIIHLVKMSACHKTQKLGIDVQSSQSLYSIAPLLHICFSLLLPSLTLPNFTSALYYVFIPL